MNLLRAIQELRGAKEKLERAIAALEELQAATEISKLSKGRSGRKSMGAEERREVSARMKRYWEGRRKQAQPRA